MKGQYTPINDGLGIVGFSYECPKCRHESMFTNCDDGCEKCEFSEDYVDPDDWYTKEMSKPEGQRAWNDRK